MPTELYGNGGETTLSAAVDNAVTSLPVTSAAGFPTGTGQYRIRVHDELMVVTGGLGTTTWTVTRGAEGTTAAAHASGATVRHILTAGALQRTGTVLAQTHYRPGANTVLSTTSTTAVAVDATNLAVTFIVPASGAVHVMMESYSDNNTATASYAWSLIEGTARIPNTSGVVAASGAVSSRRSWSTVVTGLTAGASKTWIWAHRTSSGGTARVFAGGANGEDDFGAAIMRVEAA